jgi:hypothetical protein
MGTKTSSRTLDLAQAAVGLDEGLGAAFGNLTVVDCHSSRPSKGIAKS